MSAATRLKPVPQLQLLDEPLTLEEMDGWAARAGAYIDGLTEVAHAQTGNEDGTGKLPFNVVRHTITRGRDDFTAARVLLLKERGDG